MHWHAFMSPPVGGFFLVFPLPWKFDSYFSEGGGAACQRVFPPQRISRFNLGFVTLKTPFIFLSRTDFLFTRLLATLCPPPYTVFSPLIFLHNTGNTGGSQAWRNTDCNWMKCAAPRRRREQGERIGSPMPGNLPDNGMWPPNNIHKYSDEGK